MPGTSFSQIRDFFSRFWPKDLGWNDILQDRFHLSVLGLEMILLGLTFLFLAQPEFLFRRFVKATRTRFMKVGWVMLIFVFCWSFTLGGILSVREWITLE